MEIDRTRARMQGLQRRCFLCNEEGHIARDCTKKQSGARFRAMSKEELEDLEGLEDEEEEGDFIEDQE